MPSSAFRVRPERQRREATALGLVGRMWMAKKKKKKKKKKRDLGGAVARFP